jgi:DNA-binding GntR family transcriptional regulator
MAKHPTAPQPLPARPVVDLLPLRAASTSLASTIYQRVHEELREEIIAGTLPPGARLKTAELAARYGLSQMPIREALLQLQGEGLVVLHPNRGAAVRELDARFVRNIFDIRVGLEGWLTRQAALRMDEARIARLRAIQAELEAAMQAGNLRSHVRLNMLFHTTLLEATGNDEAIRLLDMHGYLIGALRMRFGHRPGRAQAVRDEHRAMIDALARGDAQEVGAIHDRHITRARDDMLAAMAATEPGTAP